MCWCAHSEGVTGVWWGGAARGEGCQRWVVFAVVVGGGCGSGGPRGPVLRSLPLSPRCLPVNYDVFVHYKIIRNNARSRLGKYRGVWLRWPGDK